MSGFSHLPKGRLAARGSAALFFVAVFAWFKDAPILLQYQSVQMVRAAHSLTSGNGLEVRPDMPLTRWPPLYPVLLAWLERAGLDVIPAAYLINGLTLAISLVALHGLCGVLKIRPTWPALVLYGTWAANWYLLRAVRPDSILICLSILAVWALARYFERPGWSRLAGVAALCALAPLARYMAVFTLLPIAGIVVLFARHTAEWKRFCHAGLFSIAAAAPIGLWLLRNHRLTGFLTGMSRTGPRNWAEDHTLVENVMLTLKTMALDAFSFVSLGVRLLDSTHPYAGWAVATTALAMALVAISLWIDRNDAGKLIHARTREMDSARVALIVSAGYVLVYLAALWTLWTIGNSDPINTRYVSPIYPFLLVIACRLYSTLRDQRAAPAIRAALIIVAILIAVPNLYKTVRLLQDSPGAHLTEVREYENRPGTWRQDIDWSRPVERSRGEND